MNERIRELALQAEKLADEETKAFTDNTGQWRVIWNEVYDKKFAELIVSHIVRKIEQEAEIAWAHEQGETSASMYALSLEILEDFDMELPEESEDEE